LWYGGLTLIALGLALRGGGLDRREGGLDRRPLLGIRRAAHRFAAVPWVLPQLRPRRIPQDDAQIKRKSSGPLNGTATRLWSGAQDWRRAGYPWLDVLWLRQS